MDTRKHIVWLTMVVILLVAGSALASVPEIAGSYTLIGDSDGTKPKSAATVTLTFEGSKKGSLRLLATQPGETVEDSGNYSIGNNRITVRFKEMEW